MACRLIVHFKLEEVPAIIIVGHCQSYFSVQQVVPAHLESYYVVVSVVLLLQNHLRHYTRNNDAYDVHVTLPGSIQVPCKLLRLLDLSLHQKVIGWEGAVLAAVCLPPSRECVLH